MKTSSVSNEIADASAPSSSDQPPCKCKQQQEPPRGMTIKEMLTWSWLFDDPKFWEAISESRGGRGIHMKHKP